VVAGMLRTSPHFQGTLWALLAFNAIAFAVTLLGVMSKVTRDGAPGCL